MSDAIINWINLAMWLTGLNFLFAALRMSRIERELRELRAAIAEQPPKSA